MSKLAGTLRLLLAPAVACWLAVVLSSLALAACSRSPAPAESATAKCLPVGGDKETTLTVTSPEAGALSIAIQERGISVTAQLEGRTEVSESPVERFGTIAFLADSRAHESHTVRIRSADSQDIKGEACVSTLTLAAAERTRIRAEQAFATAGSAVHSRSWDDAFEDYRSAARDYDSLHLKDLAAATRHAMAQLAYRRLDRKRDSFALASDALAAYKGDSDPILTGLLTGLQAKALIDMPGSDPPAVAGQVRMLLATARKFDSISREGARELPRLDIMSGFLEFGLDAPSRAHDLFTQAARNCRALRDWDCYAIASQNLAALAEEDKNYAFALSAYGDALEGLGPELDPKLSADIWNNLGRLQGVVGLFSSSARSEAAAMHEYARLEDCPGVRRSLARSGTLLAQMGSLSDAEYDLQEAASLHCPELLAYAATLAAPSTASLAVPTSTVVTGKFSTTTRSLHDNLCTDPLEANGLGSDNKVVIFNSLLSLGDALMLESEPTRAQRCLQQAQNYAATARTQIRLANARGNVLLEGGDSKGARAAFEQALRIANEAKLPPTYEHRGPAQIGIARAAFLGGDGAGTLKAARAALQASVTRGDIDQTVTSLRLVAAGQRASGNEGAAARILQVAADLIEAVPIDELDGEKRATYLATQHTVFTELTDLFASRSSTLDVWAGFATSERGRARSLRYAITQETRNASAPLKAPPAARYQQLLHDVIQISSAEEDPAQDALISALDQAALRERGAIEPFDRDRLTKTLDQLDATLVEYAVGTNEMFAFVINGTDARVIRLGDRRQIASAADALGDRLRDPESPPAAVRSAAEGLARLVLWPLNKHLPRHRIVFVPDDALHTIPFNVLPWSSNSGDQLVLQHAEVSIVPSALFLASTRRMTSARSNTPRMVLIGDPVFRISDWRRQCADVAPVQATVLHVARTMEDWTESLPRLPGSREEVLMIARFARQSRSGSRVETLLGCGAVPSALRQAASEHVDLLHIATHARVDAQRPRLSALALTPEAADGSPASAFGLLDILGLKLDSSLVVLSACETSRGRLLPGEGVLGPAQAFLQAGAASVVASYWRIDDQVTSRFMQRFYKFLLVDHLPASTALHRAQVDEAAASPSSDWAAFALYGWPDAGI